jgi:glycyl-tRNA synthetase beta chain
VDGEEWVERVTDFLLELRSEEIPARMQDDARQNLKRLFEGELAKAGLQADDIITYATPRRLALIAHGLALETLAVSEETKGPKVGAPPQALEGFLRKTRLTQDQLVTRDGVYFAVVEKAGRATADVLGEAIPAIIRAFPWPKSMRWGAASFSTESLRWVRPLQGIVALLGDVVVACEIDGIVSGRETVGHRFHSSGPVSIANADAYEAVLLDAKVIVDPNERERIVREGAIAAAAAAGLVLVQDPFLVTENAGLTEWPVPMLGRFDPAFLEVPEEVIQLTARVNQKYFVCKSPPRSWGGGGEADGGGVGTVALPDAPLHRSAVPLPASGEDLTLANAFVCTANLGPSDGGAAVIAGNEKVLAARLSDAKFFWEADLKVQLEDQAAKLSNIVFHEKLGTVADKVERVAKLARWLVESGVVKSSPARGGGPRSGGGGAERDSLPDAPLHHSVVPLPASGEDLATQAETAARLCKADLVTGMVGEFPELQGIMGGYYARAQGHGDAVADAIRDHYKPVGQGDDVPTAPVTVAVSLADKLDTLFGFFSIEEGPTGSRDPFALRRQTLGILSLLLENKLRLPLNKTFEALGVIYHEQYVEAMAWDIPGLAQRASSLISKMPMRNADAFKALDEMVQSAKDAYLASLPETSRDPEDPETRFNQERRLGAMFRAYAGWHRWFADWDDVLSVLPQAISFTGDRLKVQQKEAGVRHDLIDAVFSLGGEDDLVRLLARVKALQAFVGTGEGVNLLAGYKRAANILKAGDPPRSRGGGGEADGGGDQEAPLSDAPLHRASAVPLPASGEDLSLETALSIAEPLATAAIAAEDFEAAMSALASLRTPIDAFFDGVMVNDPDPAVREYRLSLLTRFRDAVHKVADFSKIEG